MDIKAESPQRKRALEDAATVTTTQEPAPKAEPDPKRQKLKLPDMKNYIILDEDGDMCLAVSPVIGETAFFIVCSKTLSRSSPVMKQIILEGYVDEDITIYVYDEQTAAMQLLLEIIHGDFRKVPQRLELDDLHDLVIIMDKYDTLSFTCPWVREWVAGVRSSEDYAKLLSVAWALGDIELFNTASVRLIETSTINKKGDLVINSNTSTRISSHTDANLVPHEDLLVEATTPLIPTNVIERMATERARLISATVAPYLRLYEELRRGNCECRFVAHHARKTASPRCRALALGSLVQGFLDMGINLTIANPACAYENSLAMLRDRVNKLAILTDRNCPVYSHDECARMQEATKLKSLGTFYFAYLGPDHGAHMLSQAKKTGLIG
ncbi:hypothetical protein LZ32DRAFT_79684 [Colletotrichum eremochloae]|nr:hypothetical protein LZ32DRAFT_79684 [Colletotrichum eremochloae]